MKRTLGIILLLLSLVFLILGLYYPFMTIKIEVDMGSQGGFLGGLIGGSIADQFNKTTSYNIIQAMKMLFEHKQYFVGVLIGLFAVLLPILKTIMSFVFLLNKNKNTNLKLYNFMGIIGKFAMADVFCVGVFVAFLYTRFNQSLKADIEIGYYYFTIYVILNIISLILLKPVKQKE
jgi:paraquat-inducible protein A